MERNCHTDDRAKDTTSSSSALLLKKHQAAMSATTTASATATTVATAATTNVEVVCYRHYSCSCAAGAATVTTSTRTTTTTAPTTTLLVPLLLPSNLHKQYEEHHSRSYMHSEGQRNCEQASSWLMRLFAGTSGKHVQSMKTTVASAHSPVFVMSPATNSTSRNSKP